jgi:4-hydroxy 2-oxovalerate aldolase
MRLIDCTIRDGGHLNKWHVPPEKVRASYLAANTARIDYFEIGYRMPKTMEGLGEFGYCEDDFIETLLANDLDFTKLLVMIDTGKVNMDDFKPAKYSPFWGVRVAAYPHELLTAMKQCDQLLGLGYHVFLNPMVTCKLNKQHLESIQSWDNLSAVEAVYIADSFGSFLPGDTSGIIAAFKEFGIDSIGFHAHNNMQLAIANTLEAVEAEVTHIDATIYGMGRGAGNAPIEIISAIMHGKAEVSYLEVIKEWYSRSGESWGLTPEYALTGMYGVHPYYGEHFAGKVPLDVMAKVFKNGLPIQFNEDAMNVAVEALK